MLSNSEQKLSYPIALLLSTERRTFEALARKIESNGDTVGRNLDKSATTPENLIKLCKKTFGRKRLFLLMDDTLIDKLYSKYIEGACDNYDSSTGNTYRSLNSIVAMITDGKTAIPIDHMLWMTPEYSGEHHKKKWEIAKLLIVKLRELIKFEMVILDGLYAIPDFMKWLIQENVLFEMRMHSNRVVEYKSIKKKLKEIFKLSGRRPKQTLRVSWHEMKLFVTALRRIDKNGTTATVFQVSNRKVSAREHVQFYGYRWDIEKFFRTAKQKLGLTHCQSRKQSRQEKHIMNVFLIYAIAQKERLRLKLKNVEMAIKSIKQYTFDELLHRFSRFGEIFDTV